MLLIPIGYKSFVASGFIMEILPAAGSAAARLKRTAAERGLLINAAFGRQPKSMIIMKSNHIVLSALQPDTLSARLDFSIPDPASLDKYMATHPDDDRHLPSPKPADRIGRRMERDRRRFSYTLYIPERRSGKDRREADPTKRG